MNSDDTQDSQAIDYSNSLMRRILAWLIYPICVGGPTTMAVYYTQLGAPGKAFMMLPIGFLSAGLMEWIQPYCYRWRRSHGDIVSDVLHILISSNVFAKYLKEAVALFAGYFLVQFAIGGALITWPGEWHLLAQLALALIIAEFGAYWKHRLFHEYHYCWRLHAVHHSSPRLYWLNAPRFHFLESTINIKGLILGLFGAPVEVVSLVVIINAMHGNWQHANVHYKLGWLNWIISSAELHRWHHQDREQFTNSNYGDILIIWDIVFGTRYLPKHLPAVDSLGIGGAHGEKFPHDWWGAQLIPFRWKAILEEGTTSSNRMPPPIE